MTDGAEQAGQYGSSERLQEQVDASPCASGRFAPLLRRSPWRGPAEGLKAPWPSGNMSAALLPALFLAPALPWRASLSCCALFSCSGSLRPLLRSSAVKAARAV